MSRDYIASLSFEGDCAIKLKNKLKHMGLHSQIRQIKIEFGDTYLWLELGASGGHSFEDVLDNVVKQLEKKFKLNWDVFAWSLHPDNAYVYDFEKKTIRSPE